MICTQQEVLDTLGYDVQIMSAQDLRVILRLHRQAERLIKGYLGYNVEYGTYTEYHPDVVTRYPGDPLVEGYELMGGRVVPYSSFTADPAILALRNVPVRSVAFVYEYSGAWDLDSLTPIFPDSSALRVADYQIDFRSQGLSWTGILFRRYGSWSTFDRGVKVVYTAGLTPDEIENDYPHFKMACLVTVETWWNTTLAQRFNQRTGAIGGAITVERLGDWSVQYDPEAQRRTVGLYNSIPIAAMKLLEKDVRVSQYL